MTNDTQPQLADRPVRPYRPGRRELSVVVGTAFALAGVTAVSWFTNSSDDVTISEPISRVEVDVSSGQVDVIGSEADDAAVKFETTSGWIGGGVDHEVDGDTLRVTGGCDTGFFLGVWCTSDLTLTVPAGTEVMVVSSAGSITATGLSGRTELESKAGDVQVSDQRDALTAHSAAGFVVVDGLAADIAKVTSSAGSVEVHAMRAPLSLDAESSAGDVRVSVPGDVSYDVETDSSRGDETVDVSTSVGAAHQIRAFSSAGSVSVVASE